MSVKRMAILTLGLVVALMTAGSIDSHATEYNWGLCTDPATHPGSGTEGHRNSGYVENSANMAMYWVDAQTPEQGTAYPTSFWAARNCDTGEWVGPW